MVLARTNETIAGDVLSSNDRFEKETILGILRGAEISNTWCDQVGR
jgi:hypothetical protein